MVFTFSNEGACITHHKTRLRGKVEDYVIRFDSDKTDLQEIIIVSASIFKQLIESYNDEAIMGRLVAKVNYQHYNSQQEEDEKRSYYFASYASELITNTETFFERHMLRIGERLQVFNKNGSIKEIT